MARATVCRCQTLQALTLFLQFDKLKITNTCRSIGAVKLAYRERKDRVPRLQRERARRRKEFLGKRKEEAVVGRSTFEYRESGGATPWEIALNLLNSKPPKKRGESSKSIEQRRQHTPRSACIYTGSWFPVARHINISCTEEGNLFKICSLSRHFAMVVCHGE